MAYAAVVSLMQILQQIRDPGRYIRHRKLQIQSLQEKVSFLHDFLEKYYVYTDKVIKDLETKIRDTAHRAEDIIESHVFTFILYKRKYRNSTYRTFCKNLDRVIKEMNSNKQEVMKIMITLEMPRRNHLPVNGPRFTFSDKKSHMVGLDEDMMKLKEWLTSASSKREVISIVGMGGIGKTTLARKLFDDSLIVCQFDIRACVTVSQEYQMREIFAGLLDSTNKLSPEMRKVGSEELADRLYKSLKGRKYIIVMDDVWDAKVWDEVKRFFPDEHNGSRIVLTTRLKNVGDYAASVDHRHDMRSLDSGESWELFRAKVFGGEHCPPCLEGIGLEIVKQCGGLPLSIVVIGSLLSMDKTVGYWETIATALKSILSTDGGQCSTIFSLSYNHLPAHLKPCFLYFAIFPEDHIIRRSEVIKLWIAEGFIKPNDPQSLEDIAGECLEVLLNRSLIMVLKLGRRGKVKSYRIHDLLRDFCTAEAQKEKFFHVNNKYSFPSKVIRSERRVSIHPVSHLESVEHAFNSNGPPSTTRSLVLFDEDAEIIVSEPSFGLLRIWHNGKWLNEFPMEVVRLVHLRYLYLRCHLDMSVPASISSLWGLQTLIIHNKLYGFTHLPVEIWTMLHLRHVHIKEGYCEFPNPPNSNLVKMADLQTLWGMQDMRFTYEIIKRIPKLKKLKVYFYIIKEWSQYHLSNVACMNELESLYISSFSRMAFPPNFKFPTALKRLTLGYCGLGWEDLTMVGSLPNLEVLKIKEAFEGRVWEPNVGEFRQLKFLQLQYLGLVIWRADESHFPKLECLKIIGCWELKEIPTEIGDIPTLEKIELKNGISSAVASAKLILDQQRSLGNDVLQVHII